MNCLKATRNSFAVIGAASVVYLVLRWIAGKKAGEDGPIRVKGGSVTIDNDDMDWEKDDSDGQNEFHYKGRPNRWNVKVLKNGDVCSNINWIEARRVKLEVGRDGIGNDGDVVFRANGAVRVSDDKNRFSASGKRLEDRSPGARVKKVVVKKLDGSKVECKFDESDKYEIELRPLR